MFQCILAFSYSATDAKGDCFPMPTRFAVKKRITNDCNLLAAIYGYPKPPRQTGRAYLKLLGRAKPDLSRTQR